MGVTVPRYLVNLTLGGEPMGVHAEDGNSFYFPVFQAKEKRANRILGYRGTAVPWSVFVEQKVEAVNHRSWWAAVQEDGNDLEGILLAARTRWTDG